MGASSNFYGMFYSFIIKKTNKNLIEFMYLQIEKRYFVFFVT